VPGEAAASAPGPAAPVSVAQGLDDRGIHVGRTPKPLQLRDAAATCWHQVQLKPGGKPKPVAAEYALQTLLRHGHLRAHDMPELRALCARLLQAGVFDSELEVLEDTVQKLPPCQRGNDGSLALATLRKIAEVAAQAFGALQASTMLRLHFLSPCNCW
jgi:hypothetical protein